MRSSQIGTETVVEKLQGRPDRLTMLLDTPLVRLVHGYVAGTGHQQCPMILEEVDNVASLRLVSYYRPTNLDETIIQFFKDSLDPKNPTKCEPTELRIRFG